MVMLGIGLIVGFVAGMGAAGFIVRHAWRNAHRSSDLGTYRRYPPPLKEKPLGGGDIPPPRDPPEYSEFDSDTIGGWQPDRKVTRKKLWQT